MSISRTSRAFCVFLSTLLVLSSFPLSALRADDTKIKYYSVEEGKEFEVEQVTTSTWGGHANIELKIKNTGDEIIDNWHITFETPYVIENIWNATIVETDNRGTYTIRNSYYNQDIGTNSEVTIGMTLALGETELGNFSDWYLLNTKTYEVESDRYFISYQEYSKWNGGFNGALMLSSMDYIEDWTLSFDSNYEITTISNAIIESSENSSYTITNDGFSQNLSSNMLLMSIQGIPAGNDLTINNVLMTSVGMSYGLSDDEDNNGIADYLEYIYSIEDTDPITPTPTDEPTVTQVPTITVEPTNEPTATPGIDEFEDSDKDGLTDREEIAFGTDKDKPDTDFDGVSDVVEIQIGYNPNDPDTDKNGVKDGDEDFDDDAITNSDEEKYGTCVFAPDSDYDDINDYDEIFNYETDPKNDDTNNDGIRDGAAIKLGFNPGQLDSDNDGIPDKDEKIQQSMSLEIDNETEINTIYEIEVKGMFTNLISETMSIEDMYGKDAYCSSIESLVGGLVNIETTSNFEEATLVFHYDDSKLIDTNEDDLIVLWHDEESGLFIEQTQAIVDTVNNTITVDLSHFSTYLVVDSSRWYSHSGSTGTSGTVLDENNYDFYFLIDFSTMMSMKNRKDAISLLTDFADNLREGDRLIPILYDSNNCYFPGFIMHKNDVEFPEVLEKVSYYLLNYYSDQYASIPIAFDGIDNAFRNNETNYIGNKKHMFILSGGLPLNTFINLNPTEASNCYSFKISNDFSASIISMNPGDPEPYNLMDPAYFYSFYTDSDCFYYDEGVDLWDSFNMLYLSVDGFQFDKDKDGIPDFVESYGMYSLNGEVFVQTETTAEDLNGDGQADGYDSDLDGIPDGEEVGKMYVIYKTEEGEITIYLNGEGEVSFSNYIPDGSEYKEFDKFIPEAGKYAFVFDMKSDPTTKHTDTDEIEDSEDARPWIHNEEMVYILVNQNEEYMINDALFKQQLYQRESNVTLCFFGEGLSFFEIWNRLGETDSKYLSSEGNGKYYYLIDSVIIITHGTPESISLGNTNLYSTNFNETDNVYTCSIGLKSKKIDKLYLYACECAGPSSNKFNMSEYFLKCFTEIGEVIAFDTFLRTTGFMYFGFGFNEAYICTKDELNSLVNSADVVFSIDLDELRKDLNSSSVASSYMAKGFLRHKQHDDNVEDIFSNDIRYGTLYYYNENGDISGDLLFYDEFEYDKLSDPFLYDH